MRKIIYCFVGLIISVSKLSAQRLLTDVNLIDTSTLEGKKLKELSAKYGNLSFSGYIQPQFQVAEENGLPAEFQGGVFPANVNNKFMLRRARLRADYMYYREDGSPSTFFVFQFDGTERGVYIRDFWGRYYENKWNLLSITAGVAARTFGFETQYSSSSRESPERTRMNQLLMKRERDLGVTFTFNKRTATSIWKKLQFDIGVYNGQGLAGTHEYDNHKDIISRFSLKPTVLPKWGNITLSGGLSWLYGGIVNQDDSYYAMQQKIEGWSMQKDSAASNVGRVLPRHYYGADMQLFIPHATSKKWATELRLEWIMGKQTATKNSTATPPAYPITNGKKEALYVRDFSGGYINLIQNIGEKNKLIVKWDYYDPNTKIKGHQIDATKAFTQADIAYTTLGFGFLKKINPYLQLTVYYDLINNELTKLEGFTTDKKDNVFTLRAQFKF